MANDVRVSNSYLATNPDYTVESEDQGSGVQRQVVAALDLYFVSDVDEAADPKYYGFLTKAGEWYILKNTNDTTFRYISGTSDYPTNWTNRASLVYDYYNVAF